MRNIRRAAILVVSLLDCLAATEVPAEARSYRLHHRFLPVPSASSESDSQWALLDTITLGSSGSVEAYFSGNGESGGKPAGGDPGSDSQARARGWYQVGIQVDEDDDSSWIIAATRACYLASTALDLTLHLTEHHLTSLSLHPSHLPSVEPLCVSPNPTEANGGSGAWLALPPNDPQKWNVRVKRPGRTYGPSTTPPPSSAPGSHPPTDPTTGLPTPPPPEKSFLQKYWLPILGIGVFVIGQLGAGAEQPAAGRAQGQGQGQRG